MSARPSIFDLSPTIHPLRGRNCHAPTQEWNAGRLPRVGGARTSYTYDTTAGRTHLRLSKVAPNGQTTAYAYDSLGNLTDVTLPSGRTLQYRDHTAYGQPKRVKDANGNWTLSKIAGALYEGGTSAYGELAADQISQQPVPGAGSPVDSASNVGVTDYISGSASGNQNLGSFASGTSLPPYSGDMTTGINPRLSK